MTQLITDCSLLDEPFDVSLQTKTKLKDGTQNNFPVSVLEDVNAIVDVVTDDAVGRARGIAELIEHRGGKIVAVHGCKLGHKYNRRCIVEASRETLDGFAKDITKWNGHVLTHMQVLEPRLTWTFTCHAPFGADLDAGTSAIFETVGANVEWELKECRSSVGTVASSLHQAIVITLPSTARLGELEEQLSAWRKKYRGIGELLPGVCLALI